MISVSKLCSFYFPFDKEAVLTMLEGKGRNRIEVLAEWEQKRDEGNAIHNQLEAFMVKQKHAKERLLPAEKGIEGYVGCIHWLMSIGYKIYGAELSFDNMALGVTGRIDALFEKDDHFLVVDWKSSTGSFERDNCQPPLQEFFRDKHHQHLYQLLIQSFLTEHVLNKPTTASYVVQNGNQFEIHHSTPDHPLVVSSVNTYHSM